MGGVASKYKKLYNNNDTKKNQKKSVNNRRYTNKHKSGFQMEQDIEDLKERFERIKKLITTVLKKKGVNSYNANSYKDSDDETKKQILIYIMLDAKLPNTVRTLKDKHYYYRSIMNLISIIKKDSIDDIEDHIDYIDNKIQNVKYKRIINDLIHSLQNVIDKKRIKEEAEQMKKEKEEKEKEKKEKEKKEKEEKEKKEKEEKEKEEKEKEEKEKEEKEEEQKKREVRKAVEQGNNLYNVLNVSKTASRDEITRAYRKIARSEHPNKGGDPEKFKMAKNAYDILYDIKSRQLYDKLYSEPQANTETNANGKTNSKYDLDADEIKWLAEFMDKNPDMKVNRSK